MRLRGRRGVRRESGVNWSLWEEMSTVMWMEEELGFCGGPSPG